MVVVDNQGFLIDKFRIPPFQLNQGEIVTLNLWSGGHFYNLEKELISIFNGNKLMKEVRIIEPLIFAEHIRLNRWTELLYPMTIKRYLRKNSAPTDMPLSIFPDDRLKPKNRVSHLAGNPRRFLSIYASLSKCNGLIFDLAGVDPQGALNIYKIVEEFVTSTNGCAILLNNFDDMKDRCKKHYDIESVKTKNYPKR